MKITTAERLAAVLHATDGVFGKRRLVLACGCFDLVHPGHIRHLRWAAEQGDILVVSITSDRFVNKGPGRPFFPAHQRAEFVSALEMVDHVIVNDAPEPSAVIRALRPNVYVKGWEYRHAIIPELDALIETDTRVLFSPGDVVYSSTALGAAHGI